jgi:hypothetical protein
MWHKPDAKHGIRVFLDKSGSAKRTEINPDIFMGSRRWQNCILVLRDFFIILLNIFPCQQMKPKRTRSHHA